MDVREKLTTLRNIIIKTVNEYESVTEIEEVSTLTVDKSIMYYHQKNADSHKIMMRRRN